MRHRFVFFPSTNSIVISRQTPPLPVSGFRMADPESGLLIVFIESKLVLYCIMLYQVANSLRACLLLALLLEPLGDNALNLFLDALAFLARS